MGKELTQKELLGHLLLWFELDNIIANRMPECINIPFTKTEHENCKQAYQQIKKILKEHFKKSPGS